MKSDIKAAVIAVYCYRFDAPARSNLLTVPGLHTIAAST